MTNELSENTEEVLPTHSTTVKYTLIYGVLGSALSLIFSYLFSGFNDNPSGAVALYAGFVGALYMLVLVFQSFFIQNFYVNTVLVFVHSLFMLAFFYGSFSWWFFLGILALVSMWAIGFYRGKHELSINLKLNFWRYSSHALVKSITGMAFFIGFIYAGLFVRAGSIPYAAYEFTASRLPGLEYIAPDFSPEMNVTEFFNGFVFKTLKKQSGFESLPKAQQDEASRELAEQLLTKTEKAVGAEVKNDESVLQYGYRLIGGGISYVYKKGLGFLIVGAIIVFAFLSIKGVMFFVQWPLLGLGMIIYKLLRMLGVITITEQAVQKEVAVIH